MIASVRGELLQRDAAMLVVEVGGLGYRVQVTPETAMSLTVGQEAFLHVHHHIREDAQVLYGFRSSEERGVFETLIGTHGVGPAMALAILSVHTPSALAEAVATDDTGALCLVPGVGKKTATRLLVELKSRLVLPEVDPASSSEVGRSASGGQQSVRSDVREALVGLGYGAEEISRVLADLPEADTSEALREALKRLAVT